MIAWVVRAEDDGDVVAFADDEDALRRDFGDGVRARREPRLDGRENNPPTYHELMRDFGWWVSCATCGHRLTSDGCDDENCTDDDDHTQEPVVIDGVDGVFCSRRCSDGWEVKP